MNDLLRSICSKREIKQIEAREVKVKMVDKYFVESRNPFLNLMKKYLGKPITKRNMIEHLDSQITKNDALLGAEYWDKGL